MTGRVLSPLPPSEVLARLERLGREWRDGARPYYLETAGLLRATVALEGERFWIGIYPVARGRFDYVGVGAVAASNDGSMITFKTRPSAWNLAGLGLLAAFLAWMEYQTDDGFGRIVIPLLALVYVTLGMAFGQEYSEAIRAVVLDAAGLLPDDPRVSPPTRGGTI